MARPAKQTVTYFPHQCQHGRTMFILEQRYGNDGYAFWFKLLECLGSTEGHCVVLETAADWEFLAAKTHLDTDTCRKILDLLADLEAIDTRLWKARSTIWSDKFVSGIADVYRKRVSETPPKPSNSRKKPGFRRESGVGNLPPPLPPLKVKESKVDESRVEDIPLRGFLKTSLEVLASIPGYPLDEQQDTDMLTEFAQEFPTLVLAEEFRQWKAYKRDHPLTKKSSPRAQLRNWLTKAVEFKERDKDGTTQRRGSREPASFELEYQRQLAEAEGKEGDAGSGDVPDVR